MDRYNASEILKKYQSGRASKEEIDNFMKVIISETENAIFQDNAILSIMNNYKGPYKNATKLSTLFDYANETTGATGYSRLRFTDILQHNPELRFYDAYAFMKSAEKGSLHYGKSHKVTNLYDFQTIFEDKNLDLKTFNQCYRELKGTAFEKIDLNTLKEIVLDPDIDSKKAIEKLNALPEKVLKKIQI